VEGAQPDATSPTRDGLVPRAVGDGCRELVLTGTASRRRLLLHVVVVRPLSPAAVAFRSSESVCWCRNNSTCERGGFEQQR
jgi:hypothetical protein